MRISVLEQKVDLTEIGLCMCPICKKETVQTVAVNGSLFRGHCLYCGMWGDYSQVKGNVWNHVWRSKYMDSVSKSKCAIYSIAAFAAGTAIVIFILGVLAALGVVSIEIQLDLSG